MRLALAALDLVDKNDDEGYAAAAQAAGTTGGLELLKAGAGEGSSVFLIDLPTASARLCFMRRVASSAAGERDRSQTTYVSLALFTQMAVCRAYAGQVCGEAEPCMAILGQRCAEL